MLPIEGDTIVAIATPKGVGGIGIIRISGALVQEIIIKILKDHSKIVSHKAIYTDFLNVDLDIIDRGIAIFFKSPHSFTGEDVLELHGHGGPIILNMLIKRVIALGARIAEPGEFSKRAFLANKLDLIQAESIVALINAQTEQAAKAAIKSLQGEFSKRINILLEKLIVLRANIEALIDFPEDDVDPLSRLNINNNLNMLIDLIQYILQQSKHGALLSDGIKAVILGKPNVGKSSLLNALSEEELAIVTDIPGTTRDLVSNRINLEGLVIDFVDTAGIRETQDIVEQIGVEKAIKTLEVADLILLMLEAKDFLKLEENPLYLSKCLPVLINKQLLVNKKILIVINKIDLISNDLDHFRSIYFNNLELYNDIEHSKVEKYNIENKENKNINLIFISIKNNFGMQELKQQIKKLVGLNSNWEQSAFFAKLRHIKSLEETLSSLLIAKEIFDANYCNWDLFAEELRNSQQKLSQITGIFTNEDLLGRIFSEFCIGK